MSYVDVFLKIDWSVNQVIVDYFEKKVTIFTSQIVKV